MMEDGGKFSLTLMLNVLIAYASSDREAIFIERMDAGADSISRVCAIQFTIYILIIHFLLCSPMDLLNNPADKALILKSLGYR